jgi:hypothetical protein
MGLGPAFLAVTRRKVDWYLSRLKINDGGVELLSLNSFAPHQCAAALTVDHGHPGGVVAVAADPDAPGEAVEVGALVGGQP